MFSHLFSSLPSFLSSWVSSAPRKSVCLNGRRVYVYVRPKTNFWSHTLSRTLFFPPPPPRPKGGRRRTEEGFYTQGGGGGGGGSPSLCLSEERERRKRNIQERKQRRERKREEEEGVKTGNVLTDNLVTMLQWHISWEKRSPIFISTTWN